MADNNNDDQGAAGLSTEWAVGLLVIGAFVVLLGLRTGFSSIIPRIGS